jgi:hypothetical protein
MRLTAVALVALSWSTLESQVTSRHSLAGRQTDSLVSIQLRDTSFIHSYVALDWLARVPSLEAARAAARFGDALRDSSLWVRRRALAGISRVAAHAQSVVAAVADITRDPTNPLRNTAMGVLADIGAHTSTGTERSVIVVSLLAATRDTAMQTRLAAIGALGNLASPSVEILARLRELSSDAGEVIALGAARSLLALRDSSTALSVLQNLLTSAAPGRRLTAAGILADLHDSTAVPVLVAFLQDTSFTRRSRAALALALMGPLAAGAVPELTTMMRDTVRQPLYDGAAFEYTTGAQYAVWALSKIIPFRTGSSYPLYATIESGTNSLRSDGLGPYAWGVDSVAAFLGDGLFLMLPGDYRGPWGPYRTELRRSLTFDLSTAITTSGARPRGVVHDNEAHLWIWNRRDPQNPTHIISIQSLPVSTAVQYIDRVEIHFRIGGVLHELQMGPFAEGQAGGVEWYTGVNGEGTTLAEVIHPSDDIWIVRAPRGSKARLWSFEDRAHPVNRGLYAFPFEIVFRRLPAGPYTACVPYPATCK